MKKVRWFKYIKFQIAIYYLLASILLVGVFSLALYYSISNIVLDETLASTTTAVESSGQYIESYIDRLKALAYIIGDNPDTAECLCNHDDNLVDGIEAMIQSVLDSDDYLQSIVIVSKDGHIITNEANLNMVTSEDMMEESWYLAATSNEMPVLTSARMQDFSMEKDQWVISVSREILDEAGNNIGVLLIDINYEVFESYLENLNLGSEGFVFIINDSGEVVYHTDTEYFVDEGLRNELISIASMHGYDRKMDKLIHTYDLENADWTLVGVSSLDGLKGIRRQIVETVVIIGLILLLVVLGSGFVIAERITKPIKALESAMKETDSQLKQVEIHAEGSYEATQLTLQFNKMLERIGKLMADVKEKEKYLRVYEINALQSQINPHFLYNTLDTIVWMAEFEDSEQVIAITKSLARFFRISLSNGAEMITLVDELDHVKQYLYIQKQRYMEKLNYHFYIQADLPEVMVPKIIIQPIVENAIYHGIRDLDEPGTIDIEAKLDDGIIYIVVKDNGVGFEYRGDGKLPKSHKAKLGGVGLKNVEDRLKLYFGEMAAVVIDSSVGKGTSVTIAIPMDVKGSHD